MLRNFWHRFIGPAFRRPPRFQVAAMCFRHAEGPDGLEILLITSRDTGRWVLPKGWPKAGLDSPGTAMEEAWEEAGVVAPDAQTSEIGSYRYDKRLDSGLPMDTLVFVYAAEVTEPLRDDYPEAGQRERRWVPPSEAATMVDEPGLQELLSRVPTMMPQHETS
ncbi:8-oxo-dGTP pyrophosphatase MutT, NUDIX family [Alloyangia pacifica]|uniref:8-oxo-dGTP pyrophosphatase MutT, NUDIX family n=2 Tax=Alloyangia pacifica TaxID=311180 RepID=A0A1I6RPW5_9RHOB|nr:NUDIX hydrolase [Alloyangia pacifica]SDG55474.1 8-oxo-dGTP pyrophosphatase MutT, NUDIX family [Alloyangia pacifica]SFS66724.1 8-oxo-dGTP pyrophosphatase MutT, NUDIX family [Alloyangia pacifica]